MVTLITIFLQSIKLNVTEREVCYYYIIFENTILNNGPSLKFRSWKHFIHGSAVNRTRLIATFHPTYIRPLHVLTRFAETAELHNPCHGV
jgi:hypothetical protein